MIASASENSSQKNDNKRHAVLNKTSLRFARTQIEINSLALLATIFVKI